MPIWFFHEDLLVIQLYKKSLKAQIYYVLYSSKALIFKPDLLFFYLKILDCIYKGKGLYMDRNYNYNIIII